MFLYAAFLTFYVFDYFVFERVQLYTYDLIHERLGMKLIWGGLVVYGWLYILPLWGMAAYPNPGFSPACGRMCGLSCTATLFLFGWAISRGANMQKYTFKRWPERKFLGFMQPEYIQAGERKILCSGFWGVCPPLQLPGRGLPFLLNRTGVRLFRQSLGVDLLRLHRHAVHMATANRR